MHAPANAAPISPIDTTTHDFVTDPIRNFDAIRKVGRIVYVPSARAYLTTGYRDAIATLRDPKLHALDYPGPWRKIGQMFGRDYSPVLRLFSYMPFAFEGEKHHQLRAVLAQALSPFAAGNQHFDASAASKVAKFRQRGGGDLAKDISRHLLFDMMCDLMQVPNEDRSQIRPMANLSWAVENAISVTRRDVVARETRKCIDYLKTHAASTIGKSDPGFLTGLYNALPDDEEDKFGAVAIFATIMLAMGNDAIGACLSMGVRRLLDPTKESLPQQEWDAASDDVIRYATPVGYTVRAINDDTVIAGCPVARGEHVFVSLLAANHDPEKFGDHADKLTRGADVGLAFGAGRRLCVGARVSRTIVNVAFRALGTLPTMRLAGEAVHGPGHLVRTLESLPVELV